MPILPLIDLLILMSTGSLLVGFILKAIALTTRYRPTVLGFTSIDFVLITGICLGLALVLAARTYVKLNEPRMTALRSRQRRSRLVPEDPEDLLEHHRDMPGRAHLSARVCCSTAVGRGQPAPVGH